MLHVFPVTLQETSATLQEIRATLQETPATLHETMQLYTRPRPPNTQSRILALGLRKRELNCTRQHVYICAVIMTETIQIT